MTGKKKQSAKQKSAQAKFAKKAKEAKKLYKEGNYKTFSEAMKAAYKK